MDTDSNRATPPKRKDPMERVSTPIGDEKLRNPKLNILPDSSLSSFAKYLVGKRCKYIIVLTGAGISTSAGIPDFRTPDTGLYSNLKKYNLPYPEAIFDINYFRSNPNAFYELSRELFPGSFKPTKCHQFIKLLADQRLLLRNYTQNIDMLETIAGVPEQLLIECHGSFNQASCVGYRSQQSLELDYIHISSIETEEIVQESIGSDQSNQVLNIEYQTSDVDEVSILIVSDKSEIDNSNDRKIAPLKTIAIDFDNIETAKLIIPTILIDITESVASELPEKDESQGKSHGIDQIKFEALTFADTKNVIENLPSIEEIEWPGCGRKYTQEEFKSKVFQNEVSRCECEGFIKPDIVFFGEQLPPKFHDSIIPDFKKCDALIIMGTSLGVEPFCDLINRVGPKVPRLFINRDVKAVGLGQNRGFDFQGNVQKYRRDALFLGSCDDGVTALCKELGDDFQLGLENLCSPSKPEIVLDVDEVSDAMTLLGLEL